MVSRLKDIALFALPSAPALPMVLVGPWDMGVDAFETIACGTSKAFVLSTGVVVLISVHSPSKKYVLQTRSWTSSGNLLTQSMYYLLITEW